MMRVLYSFHPPTVMAVNVPPTATAFDGAGRTPGQEVEAGIQSPTFAIEAVGASVAAAGSLYSDAGALPSGTANVYPTTAADGTKGVIISASDQVTGRRMHIGNGVSTAILKVYGPAGAVINGAAANAAFSSASGKGAIAVCLSGSGNTWLMW